MTKLHLRQTINPNLLLLDGLSRAGKFLLGKIVSHFERVEFFQFSPLLEYIPIYWRLGCYREDSAAPILKTAVDLLVYERTIGRHLNTRLEDDTAIHKAPDYERYVRRMVSPRGIEACEELVQENRYSTFLTHEVLPNVFPYFEAYSSLKMINFQRHPIDIAYSWHRKSLGEIYSSDPVIFRPLIQGEKSGIPWFAFEWKEAYEAMSPADRVIRGVLELQRHEQEAYGLLPDSQKKQILFVGYEELITKPKKAVQKISEFLQTQPLENIDTILRRERCFRELPQAEREKKYEELSGQASKELVRELAEASRAYETKWGLNAFASSAVVSQ